MFFIKKCKTHKSFYSGYNLCVVCPTTPHDPSVYIPKIIERRKAQDAELKLYVLLEREIRMGAISASECFVSH